MNYVDLQVNGHYGVDFNSDDWSIEHLESVCEKMKQNGVRKFLATLITDDFERMETRIRRWSAALQQSERLREVVVGLHIEGPFLSHEEGFVGAHPPQHTCNGSIDLAKRLYDAGEGWIRLITMAPERDAGMKAISWFASQGVLVAAGHTNASRDWLVQACDAGLSGFTHLGNGCPHTVQRHDNIVQRVLSLKERFWVSLIADGVHLPRWLLRLFIDVIGMDRSIIVTDAISAAGLGPGTYQLASREVEIDESGISRCKEGVYLAGSTATMRQCENVLVEVGFSEDQRRQLLSANALTVLGQSAETAER